MESNKTVRVACINSFWDKEPTYHYVDNIALAKELLRKFAAQGKYQSDLCPIPGLRRVAVIETLNDTDGEWDAVPMA